MNILSNQSADTDQGGSPITALCVYCGSRKGSDPEHARQAAALGQGLAERKVHLVYGAGGIGLMNEVAEAALRAGGTVAGVIPRHLAELELKHDGLTETVIVDTMHERKRIMFERADAFAVLPGGYGTLDELFEIVTWKMLGLHAKPIFVINSAGYWDPLRALLAHIEGDGFTDLKPDSLIQWVPDVDALLLALDTLPPRPPGAKAAGAHLA